MSWRRDLFEVVVGAAKTFAPHASEPPSTPRKIFVLRNNDIGDLLVITPIFDALRRKFPSFRDSRRRGRMESRCLT